MTYRQWAAIWMAECVRPTQKARTETRYAQLLDNHILPALGEQELSAIGGPVLQAFVGRLLTAGNLRTGRGLSGGTVR